MTRKTIAFFTLFFLFFTSKAETDTLHYNLSDYGLYPNTQSDVSALFVKALQKILQDAPTDKALVIYLDKGTYNFYPENASKRSYFISNHDQINPKAVGLAFEGLQDLTFDGKGADLIFHGNMLPLSIINNQRCTFRNFQIDFAQPHICQVKVLENDTASGNIIFQTAPWVTYQIVDSTFYHTGHHWKIQPRSGIAFEEKTRRLVFNTSDIAVGTNQVSELAPGIIKAHHWKNHQLIPGTIVALRSGARPAPGLFIDQSVDIRLEHIQVHYAEGMGLLAQVSENITLDRFSVCLRGENDPRYFTTQADATHFSGCKGKIIAINGLYEGMMDDAINVHGTYLKVVERVDKYTLVGEYMHPQSYGFEWGRVGDTVQFISSKTMELAEGEHRIAKIQAIDQATYHGAKKFEITFQEPVEIDSGNTFGMENLSWTPEVYFAYNIIRNNRARGSLFSTPKKTLVAYNTFDHTSGTAILLCGDCNGWYETGACKDITIRNNQFINALTNMFQFTNAIISISPEIPDLAKQKRYFHQGIVIENNLFQTFDIPILYAKSTDGLSFRYNKIERNRDYPAFHWNKAAIFLERVKNIHLDNNDFQGGFDLKRDVKTEN